MGVVVWPMVELEADDALVFGARSRPPTRAWRRSRSGRPTRISRSASAGTRRAGGPAREEDPGRGGRAREVRRAAGLHPRLPPRGRRDSTAIRGQIGAVGAARLLNRYGPIETILDESLRGQRDRAPLQDARDPPRRCSSVRRRGVAAVAGDRRRRSARPPNGWAPAGSSSGFGRRQRRRADPARYGSPGGWDRGRRPRRSRDRIPLRRPPSSHDQILQDPAAMTQVIHRGAHRRADRLADDRDVRRAPALRRAARCGR